MARSCAQARLNRRQLIAASSLALTTMSIESSEARQATPVAGSPTLAIEPGIVAFDQPFRVTISDLPPGVEVTIRSSFLDGRARTWRAEATWIADAGGYVDCSAMIPNAGDFTVADSMAFIWAASAGAPTWFIPSLYGANPVTFTAHLGDQQVDAATIERVMLPPDWPVEEMVSPEMVATFVPPIGATTSPAPAVIVIGGSEGGAGPVHVAALFAMHGYTALALGYFGSAPLPPTLQDIPLEYFGNAIGWLQSHPAVDAERIAMVGFSRGGEGTLLVASHYPEIKAAISYAGSGLVFGAPGIWPSVPAWTWQGEPVPYVTADTPAAIATAEIPVEDVNGPIVLIAGDADLLWGLPAPQLSAFAWRRLQEHAHPWPNQFLVYPGAGHGITPPYAAMTFQRDHPSFPMGGSPLADQIASANAWQAVLNTLAWRFSPDSVNL